ncbi:hypothetical protein MBTS_05955 [Methylobacterium bullatum]|nr:hypothetical protein [Methylobacterium bullatum]
MLTRLLFVFLVGADHTDDGQTVPTSSILKEKRQHPPERPLQDLLSELVRINDNLTLGVEYVLITVDHNVAVGLLADSIVIRTSCFVGTWIVIVVILVSIGPLDSTIVRSRFFRLRIRRADAVVTLTAAFWRGARPLI